MKYFINCLIIVFVILVLSLSVYLGVPYFYFITDLAYEYWFEVKG